MKRNGPIVIVCICVVLLFHPQSILYSQVQTGSFKFEEQGRNYEVYLPQNFKPNMPLVISLHGYTETIEWYKRYTLLHEIADTAGFITVYPAAIGKSWNSGLIAPGWPVIDTSVNDVGFISALIDTLKAHYDIDMRRVYCCGYSLGGEMTYKLAGELGHRFAAFASITGLINDNSAITCKPVRAFPILHMHGTLDKYETWSGDNKNLWTVPETLNFWLENNGCSIPGDTVSLVDLDPGDGCTVEKISYTNCSGEGRLIFYKILDGGHSWPGSAFAWNGEGNKNMDINANVEILNFFKQFENPLVYVPDTAFLYALIDEGVDTNEDSLISYAEAEAVTYLDVSGEGGRGFSGRVYCNEMGEIINLKGIEAFINLDTLYCHCNLIESLDLSSNTNLEYLECGGNSLNSLGVSNNTSLTYLDCGSCKLGELDVSGFTGLQSLNCSDNQLTSLDASGCINVRIIECSNNQLASIELSLDTALKAMVCRENRLTTLDLSYCAALTHLDCSDNHLATLDLSGNTALDIIALQENPTLHEVCVWETFTSDSVNITIRHGGSPNVYFTTECVYNNDSIVFIPDTAFLNALIDEGVDTNEDSLISFAEAEAVIALNVGSKEISNLTGIEAFMNLDSLSCNANPLTSLDVSNNTALTYLDVSAYCTFGGCFNGTITTLDISNNTALEVLYCGGHPLTSLDVSNNTALTILYCDNNQLTSLDVSNNIHLTELGCFLNQLTSLDVSNNTALTYLGCSDNQLTSLDVSNNIHLSNLNCWNNQLTSLNLSSNNSINWLGIMNMPSLHEVCVWEMPFPPPGVYVDTTGSPNVYFTTECATGIEETSLSEPTIYPNPTNSLLTIETDQPDKYTINITTLNGQKIHIGEMEGTIHQIDLSSFQKGVYFITIRSKEMVSTRKIIKL